MMPGFELLLNCNNKLPKMKKEDTTWVPTDWVDYMDPDVMTTLLGDAICNIEEEEYQEACQHALKSPYEVRTSDEYEEGGEAPSDDDEGSDAKSDSSSDSSNSDSGHGDDDNNNDSESNNSEDYASQYSGNDWGEPPSDREDEDEGLYYEDYDDDVDYYDGDIEDDVDNAEAGPIETGSDAESDQYRLINSLKAVEEEVEEANNINYDDHPYGRLSDWSFITDVSSTTSPRYDKHGREIPEWRSFHNLELGSLTPCTEEEDDIDARLVVLDQKLMVHSLRTLTLENSRGDDKKMEGNELEYLPQYTYLSNKGKQDLFGEWMDSIKHPDTFVADKPTNIFQPFHYTKSKNPNSKPNHKNSKIPKAYTLNKIPNLQILNNS